jgi:ubiquinone/menaquinone biosynthesis C-methylase UbiE
MLLKGLMSDKVFWFEGMEYRILEGKKGVKEAYDEMADEYDRSEYLYWTRRMEEGEERAIKSWVGNMSAPILDVGCGTGRYAVRAARGGHEVVALDISLKMLRVMMGKAREHGISEKLNSVLADGEHLPFRDSVFNGLICTLTFDHFTDCELAAREFSRVLKCGGLCALSTFNSYTLDEFKRRYQMPSDKVPFKTEGLPPTLIYEVGHSAVEVERLFGKYGLEAISTRGCCYWHILPTSLIKYYRDALDRVFNALRPLLKYAELHAILLRKH